MKKILIIKEYKLKSSNNDLNEYNIKLQTKEKTLLTTLYKKGLNPTSFEKIYYFEDFLKISKNI